MTLDKEIKRDFLQIIQAILEHLLLPITMSVVPPGVYVAHKVRQNEEKLKNTNQVYDLFPTKYSSKYMNSIWGMYNRYSVHNLKKNMDPATLLLHFPETVASKPSVEINRTDLKGSLTSTNSFLAASTVL